MSQKKTLSKADKKMLLQFTKSLPQIYRVNGKGEPITVNNFTRGRLLPKGVQKTIPNFKPDLFYSTKGFIYEDPYNLMEKVFLKAGKEAMILECQKWMERYEAQKQNGVDAPIKSTETTKPPTSE